MTRADRSDLELFLWLWFGFVFLFFSVSSTQLPHYLLYGATPLFLLMARYREELRNRFLTLLPALLLTSLLFFLPEIWRIAEPLVDDAYTRAIMTVAPEAFDLEYRIWTGLGSRCRRGALLPEAMEALATAHGGGLVVAAVVAFGLFPTYGEIQQGPTKEAALLARSEGWDVVMWRLDMPSFALYYGDITPLRSPEAGEVVFTRVTRLDRAGGPHGGAVPEGRDRPGPGSRGRGGRDGPERSRYLRSSPQVDGIRSAGVGPDPPHSGGAGEVWTSPLFFFFNSLSSYTGPAFWAHVTILGDGLVCAVLLLPWIRRNPERVWGGLLGAVLMVVVLRGFKDLLSLPRPLGVLPEDSITVIGPGLRRSAFPSGHTATMALFAGVWALSTSRRLVSWMALVLAVLVGVSRMAVGVHWPTDVLAGFALGWVSAWIGLRWAFQGPLGIGEGRVAGSRRGPF